MPVKVTEYIETTFEHQCLVQNPRLKDGGSLWWMRPKNSFEEDPGKNLPAYLYLPPEHLMLLKNKGLVYCQSFLLKDHLRFWEYLI